MPRSFDIPATYRSELVTNIKRMRSSADQRKQDFSPSTLVRGRITFNLPRFFGLCYGVENAMEIAYRAIEENPGRRIFLLSEMIHNPQVNEDLVARGVQFLQTPAGEQIIPYELLEKEDVIIIPAFGTTKEIFKKLHDLNLSYQKYDATCPFVTKVWNRGAALADQGFTVVIHGKHSHEETRATFSHIKTHASSVVVKDIEEAALLCRYIRREVPMRNFFVDFAARYSESFNPDKDLVRLAVVNQTTMLAEETKDISQMLRTALADTYGVQNCADHFADTRDTLCYATSENQRAMRTVSEIRGDLALVVGGYNSSNTSHLVEICEGKMPVYFIKGPEEILDLTHIRHLDLASKEIVVSDCWFPQHNEQIQIVLSAGASCPDILVEQVIERISNLALSAQH